MPWLSINNLIHKSSRLFCTVLGSVDVGIYVCLNDTIMELFLPRDASAERGDATVSRPSVRLSVRNDQVPCSNTLEFFENNFMAE